MENNKRIVRVVMGQGFPTRKITAEEMEDLELKYIDYATGIAKKLDDENGMTNVILDKMLSPFEYWLRDYCFAENLEKQKNAMQNGKKQQ